MKKKLKDICTQVRGVSYKPSDLRDEKTGVPILRANNIQDTGIVLDELVYVDSSKVHSEQYLLTDDIVICASSGSKNLVGKAATFKSSLNASFGAFCKVVRINNSDDLFKAYIQQYFQSKIYRNAISESSVGANINNIKTEDIEALEISLPPKEEQQKIAAELDTIQSAIDNKKQQLSLLDEAVKSEFVEMFGDPILNDKGWDLEQLNNLGKWESGGTPSRTKSKYFTGTIPWYSAGELNSLYLQDSIEKITEEAIKESSAKLFKKGSLFVGMYDTAAFKMGIATKECSSNQACANILPNEKVNVLWLYYELLEMKEYFLRNRHGVRQKNLNLGMIKSFEIPVPPLTLQNQFAAFVQQIDKSKFVVKQQIADLQELLDSKMQEYFS